MRRKYLLLGIVGLFVGCLMAITPGSIGSAYALPLQDTTSRLIVKFKSTGAPAVAAAPLATAQMQGLTAAAGVALAYVRPMAGGAHVVSLPAAMTNSEAAAVAAAIARNATSVAYAEPDVRMYPTLLPNDPLYASQWHYHASATHGMNLPGAWDITTGSATTVAAVIDTGILPHADFDPARILPGYDMISNLAVANDGDLRDADPSDPGDWITPTESTGGGDPILAGCPVRNSSWHGTHVAGTIGARTNNTVGVAGVNWSTKILPVRALGKCGGFTSDIADAISWAAGLPVPGVPNNPNPADVINLSLGGTGACGITYQTAITNAVTAGTAVVVSAGNSSADAGGFQPASCNGVITVAAHNNASYRTYYSNFGSVVEIMAPGGETSPAATGGVLSTLDSGTTTPLNDNVYAYYQGTSMAAPHVVGLATLMLAANPALTPAQISTAIQASSRAFVPGGYCALNPGMCGAGIADAQAAVALVALPATPTALGGSSVSSTRIDLSWTDNATNETGYKVERKVGVGGVYTQIAALAADVTGYSDTSAVAEADYFYRVRASRAYGDSAYSNEANIAAIAAPSALSAAAISTSQIDLGWTDNSAIETGFKIERSSDGGVTYNQVGTVAADITAYSDTGLTAGTTYRYRVRANNASGNSSYSNVAVATTLSSGGGGGGGGGCVLNAENGLFPLLMLTLLALGYLGRRRSNN